MYVRIAALAGLLLLASCKPTQTGPTPAQRMRELEHGLVEFAPGPPDSASTPPRSGLAERMVAHKIPGVGLAVIHADKLDWATGYGVLDADTNRPVTTETIFQAASTTKMLVAATVLHFVEQGRLDLDRSVNDYLDSWRLPENDLTRGRPVTLRLLLTHQAGLPMTAFSADDGPPPTLVQVLNGEPPARNRPAVVEFLPGSRWQYSNIGYVVIQQLLQDVTGTPLPRLMKEVLFDPLGMDSSTLQYPLRPALQAREIRPHDAEGRPGEPQLPSAALAQGGLLTTPSDLARFTIEIMRAFRGESTRVLSREMARAMLQSELDLDPALLGMPLRQGLGVLLSAAGEPLWFGHPGENLPGASSWVMGYPELATGFVLMTNGAKGNLLAMELLPAFTETYVRRGKP